MVIVQESWSIADPQHLSRLLEAAVPWRTDSAEHEELVLLPISERVIGISAEQAIAAVAQLAARRRLVVAGAVRTDSGTLGFVVGADGQVLLRSAKILPDLAEGFSATSSALTLPAAFAVARLRQGHVAVLVGEDATAAHLVRAAMWRGAELVLNPSREFSDGQFAIRQQARMARAYENHLCLVTASPLSITQADGFQERLPPASALFDEWALPVRSAGGESFMRVSLDIEAVRRRRSEYFGNLCITTRPTLYAPGYRQQIAVEEVAREALGSVAAPSLESIAGPGIEDWTLEGKRRARAFAAAHPRRADLIDRYDILLGQVVVRHVTDAASAPEVMTSNLDHALDLTGRFAAAPDTRLVVFPEFFLQGSRMGRMPQIFPVAGINLKASPHLDRLARFAQDHKVHIAGAVLEIDDDWPGHLFNTAIILDDRGELIHRYRKIQCADVFGFLDTTPGSVLDRYLELYGYEALFPVADTRLGRLATAICFDMNFPELFRAFAQRGAEVLLHPTAEPHNVRRRAWENGRQVRAWENTMYIASAGLGGEYWNGMSREPATLSSRGHSKLVNFDGTVQSVADGPGAVPLGGAIDLRALREARADARHCMLLWDEPRVYEPVYSGTVTIPDNLVQGPDDRPYLGGKALKEVIARFTREGIFIAPGQGEAIGGSLASGGL